MRRIHARPKPPPGLLAPQSRWRNLRDFTLETFGETISKADAKRQSGNGRSRRHGRERGR